MTIKLLIGVFIYLIGRSLCEVIYPHNTSFVYFVGVIAGALMNYSHDIIAYFGLDRSL